MTIFGFSMLFLLGWQLLNREILDLFAFVAKKSSLLNLSSDSVSNTKDVFSMSQSVCLFSDCHFFSRTANFSIGFLGFLLLPVADSLLFCIFPRHLRNQQLSIKVQSLDFPGRILRGCQGLSTLESERERRRFVIWSFSVTIFSLVITRHWHSFCRLKSSRFFFSLIQLSDLFHFRLFANKASFFCVVPTNFPETNLMSIGEKNWTFSLFWGSFLEDSAFWTPNSVAGQKFGNES